MVATTGDEKRLIEEARKGDARAFGALVRHYERQVFGIARGITRQNEDAWDVTQEAFLRAYRGLGSFKGDSSFYTWLYRITVNLALDCLQKRGRMRQCSFEDEPNLDDQALDWDGVQLHAPSLDHLDRQELAKMLAAAVESLSPVQRAVITLREVDELSYKEIAEVMNCNIGTVMSRLFHARLNLQKQLTGYLEGEP